MCRRFEPSARTVSATSSAYTSPIHLSRDNSIMARYDGTVTNTDPTYTDAERDADLATLRALSRKLQRQKRTLDATSAERLEVVRRLRMRGGATYPVLADAMGTSYSTVQNLLARIDNTADDTEGQGE